MNINLCLGGLRFHIESDRALTVNPELEHFLTEDAAAADVTVHVSWDWEALCLPQSPPLGEDAISRYYMDGDICFCLTRGGPKGPVACTRYPREMDHMLCVLNERPFLAPPKTLASVLRFLPMRAIFQRFGVLFLHAAQIGWRGRGVLFAAPSGTGKTTQAKLWVQERGAELLCNDRTLVRRTGGVWRTYGYPVDGSEPVRSGAVRPLGCVVVLEQGRENRVLRLRPGRAAGLLMRQAVIDTWSAGARSAAMEQILTLLEEIPAYLLTCTPDGRAVAALEAKWKEDEVLENGSAF